MMGEVIRVSGRAPDVGDLLREAMVSQRFADVALCCSGGQRFLAHRLVLSAASPYLQEVLLAHGKAAGYCEPITVILAEVEGPELAAILGFVYTGSATVPRSRLEAFTRAAETLHVRIPPLTLSSTFRHLHHLRREDLASSREDCKLDNVKIEETKLDSRYLGCEQYPSHDKWYNSTGCWPFDGCLERLQHRDDWKTTSSHQPLISQVMHQPPRSTPDISRDPQEPRRNFPAEICHSSSDKIKQSEAPAAPGSCRPMDLPAIGDAYGPPVVTGSQSEDGSYELHLRRCHRIISGADGERPLTMLDPFRGSDDSVSRMSGWESSSSRRDEAAMRLQQGEAQRYNDFEVAVAESRSNAAPSLPLPVRCTEATGRSSVTFEKQDYDAVGPAEAVGTSTPAATVTSNIAGNAAAAAAAAQRACGESCCRWRSPRRHVANRVPASPWSQLARPAHNSPKIRPIVLRNRDDSDEAARLRWNEAVSTNDTQPRVNKRLSPFLSTSTSFVDHETSSSAPLDLHHARPSSGTDPSASLSPLYGFQVPKATAVPDAVDVRFVDGTRTSPDFYGPAGHQRPPGLPIAAIPTAIDVFPPVLVTNEAPRSTDRSEPISGLFEDPSSRLRPPVQKSSMVAGLDEARGVIGIGQHAISPPANQRIVNDPSACNRRTSPRVELSHPISRLCDSIRLTGEIADRGLDRSPADAAASPAAAVAVAAAATASAKEIIKINVDEEAQIFAGKPMFPPAGGIIQSDSNNNEASVDGSIHSRNLPRSSGDNSEPSTGVDGVGASASAEDHRCEQCGKTFVTRASLKVHGRTHSGEKPFRCADCGKEFSQLRNYKYHRSVHEGTREFAATCPECGKYFNDRGYLSSHMKIHRNRKEYACAECGKSFNQRVAYNMHVRIHTGVKPHQCEQCGKAFSRKMLLKQHLRTHSGERPYQCQICHKAFADRSNMTLHTRLHSGLKPYQCTLCSKAFTKKHHLKTHLNYHTGTKPYSCPNCSLRFSQSSNMRTHYKKCSATGGGVVNGGSVVVNANKMITSPEDNGAATSVAPVTSDKVRVKVTSSSTPARTTSALTPPSSDHESSILHESRFTEKRCKPGRPYPGLRSKDAGASAPDT